MKAALLAACLACLLSCAGAPPPKGSPAAGFDLEPKTLSAVIERIVARLDGALDEKGGRLAVAAFVRTGAAAQEGTAGSAQPPAGSSEFGEYFSDTLASAVRSLIPRARMYERKNLDLVLRENSLALSGLVDEGQARAIGTLVPIDALLAGTYTPLDAAVDVNCRLVDISTGQILFTHADRIRVDADIAAILQREKGAAAAAAPAPAPQPSAEERCRERAEALSLQLRDLSSSEKIRAVVAEAVTIPFDTGCGDVHFQVLAAFRRYGILDEEYRRFLLASLPAIQFPSSDSRALETLKYLAADGRIDAEEWAAGIALARRSSARDISSLLVVLLGTNDQKPRDEAWYELTLSRTQELVALVEKGQVGLPVAIDLDTAFSEIIDAFNYLYTPDNRVLAALYESLGGRLSKRPATLARVQGLLTVMYPRESDPAAKLKVLDWIARSFRAGPPGEELASEFFAFLKKFEITEYRRKHPEELGRYPAEHLEIFVGATRELFCPLVASAKFRSAREERIDFCLQHGIECPGVVPSPAEAAALLSSDDWDEKLRAARMLALMGAKAAPAETALVERFGDEEGGSSAEITVFQNSVVQALGSIRASGNASLELLLEALSSLNTGVSAAAAQSLAAIGLPAVGVLIRGLQGEAGSVQFYSATALGQIGPGAKEALPELEKLARSTNSDLRGAAEKAIRAIRGR
jgi:hypothetical protein